MDNMENLIIRARTLLQFKSEHETRDILRETESNETLVFLAIKAAALWV